MLLSKKYRALFLSVCACLCFTFSASAQDAGTAKSSSSMAEILMIVIAVLLAFVIWGLGQVLIALGGQLLEKNRSTNKVLSAVMLAGLTLAGISANAQDSTNISAAQITSNYGGMNPTSFWLLALVIFIEIASICFIIFSIRRLQAELSVQKTKVRSFFFKAWWAGLDKKLFTRAVAVEQEADILLDHDYDGIRELDNKLPPWWKYGFIITIVAAVIYLFNFHVIGYGQNPEQEYATQMANAQAAKEEYEANNKDKVDENNLQMPEAAGIAAGKDIFTTTCWACHGKFGEGGAGPNLTDDYWLHKGSLHDIYSSIKHGYPDKGMQAWEKNYSAKEINNIAGFIKSIHGTNPPNAKAPQGDLFTEDKTTTADSTKVAVN